MSLLKKNYQRNELKKFALKQKKKWISRPSPEEIRQDALQKGLAEKLGLYSEHYQILIREKIIEI